MDTWKIVIGAITGNALVLAILGFLAKSFINNLLNKDIKKFELELKSKNDIIIENLKNDLKIITFEHQVKFGYIHEKRAKVIADLYKKIAETERNARQFIMKLSSDKETFDSISQEIDDLRNVFDINSIYFDKNLSDEINDFIMKLWEPVVTVQAYADVDNPTLLDEKKEKLNKVFEVIDQRGLLTKIRTKLENEFRILIGVDISDDQGKK